MVTRVLIVETARTAPAMRAPVVTARTAPAMRAPVVTARTAPAMKVAVTRANGGVATRIAAHVQSGTASPIGHVYRASATMRPAWTFPTFPKMSLPLISIGMRGLDFAH